MADSVALLAPLSAKPRLLLPLPRPNAGPAFDEEKAGCGGLVYKELRPLLETSSVTMRTLLTLLCLVALCHARPDKPAAAAPQATQFNSESVQSVLKALPAITDSFKGSSKNPGDTLRRVSAAVLAVVRDNANEDNRQQVEDAAVLTNAILDTVSELVKDLPPVDFKFKAPKIKIPEIVIPKVVIPEIPEVVIPEFKLPDIKIPNFQTDDSFKVDIPEIVNPEIVIPKFKIPEIPEVVIPAFEAPEIDIPEF